MNIAIAGYGMEGESNYNYWNNPDNQLTIIDESASPSYELPVGAQTILGAGAFEKLKDFDIVVRTASLNPNKIKTNGKVWSATNEFFEKCPAPIIGVTGTKGKGTTCSLIASILRANGRTVHLVGNIGTPALGVLKDVKPDDIVVFELSSFQLWDLEKSPHVAVVLMVEPDHLNVHADFAEYAGAKTNIASHQAPYDVVIYHPTNIYSAQIAEASRAALKQRYMTIEAAYVDDGKIVIDEHVICPVEDVGLLGAYNLENICAAVSASWCFTENISVIAKAIREFKGLEHRLEFVAKKSGVAFYNDSFSSAPTATLAAITAFDNPIVLILGGSDKGIDLSGLTQKISQTSNIKQVLLIGQVKDALAKLFENYGFEKFTVCETTDIADVVKTAASLATKNDTVLLSPGCASFGMFKNFYERGKLFKQAVNNLDE